LQRQAKKPRLVLYVIKAPPKGISIQMWSKLANASGRRIPIQKGNKKKRGCGIILTPLQTPARGDLLESRDFDV
jgi:hypothetical protein